MGIGRDSGQGDISGAAASGYRVRDKGPVLTISDADIHQPQFISSAVDPGVTGALVIAGGLQIGLGVNGLTTGDSQGEDLGVTTGGQGIIGSGGGRKSGDCDHTAKSDQHKEQGKHSFGSFHDYSPFLLSG